MLPSMESPKVCILPCSHRSLPNLTATLLEYYVVDQSQLVPMPSHMTFEEGSTLTIAAATAWSSLYGHQPKLQPGNTVLCLGTGGVSLFAAQVGYPVPRYMSFCFFQPLNRSVS